jgi:hypothetical protein
MTTNETLDEEYMILPTEDDVGRVDDWELPSGDELIRVRAQFIGLSSSFRPQHYDHNDDVFARPLMRCRACRWFEPRIFREVDGRRRYLVHRTGRTIVPGETILTSHEWVRSAYEVIEVLTTRRQDHRTGNRAPFLTQPAARVLAQAATYDNDLGQAYVDRAVA